MGMWTTENQDTMNDVLRAFSDAARRNYGSHSFESGYLQSVIISILPQLPKRAQKVLIDDMIRAAQKQEAEVVKKILAQDAVIQRGKDLDAATKQIQAAFDKRIKESA